MTYGQVIGLPFAMEGFAFFIETIFLGIYLSRGTGYRRRSTCRPASRCA
jgi:cytochrome bd-type quinol oxidase subunit 1